MGKNQIEIIINAVDKASGVLGGVGGSIQSLGKVALGAFGVIAGAVGGAIAAIGSLALDAARVEAVSATFGLLADSVGGDATTAMEQLRVATRGMVADADLMAAGNKFLAMGLADSTEGAAQLAEVATQLGMAMGEDATSSMENFALMMANQSIPRLDSFGISSGKVRERILELMDANSDMTREQAFNTAVMEQAAITMAKVGDQSGSTGAGLAQLSTMFENAKLAIGQAFVPVLGELLQTIVPLIQEYLPMFVGALQTLGEWALVVTQSVGDFVWMLQTGIEPLDAIQYALGAAFGPEVGERVGVIIDGVREFIAGVQEVLGPVMEWLAQNVELQDVLIALGVAIASVVLPALWGVIVVAAPIIGAFALVVAAAAAMRAAWENDFLGIRTALTEAWEGTILPALTQLWNWLHVNVPAAIETLRAFWVDTAWPAIQGAIQTVWPIIEGIFSSIVTWVTGTLIPTVQKLYDKWVNEVWPTIQTVTENVWSIIKGVFEEIGRWINDNIMPWIDALRKAWADDAWPAIQSALETVWAIIEPIWEAFREWLEDKLPPALTKMRGVFEDVMSALQTAIQPAKDLWDKLVDAVKSFWDWISGKKFEFNFKLPDLPQWAVPGSPLPIHTAWANFAQDMDKMRISPSIDLSGVNMPVSAARGVAQATYDQSRTVNLNMQPTQYRQVGTLDEDARWAALALGAI